MIESIRTDAASGLSSAADDRALEYIAAEVINRCASLEDENTRLRRVLAEAMLDNATLKDLVGRE